MLQICSCQGRCGTCSIRFPGLWYPVSRFGFYTSRLQQSLCQSFSPAVANQGHEMSLRLWFSHHLLPHHGSWSFYIRQIVGSTAPSDDPKMLPCKLSDLMATNLHGKAISRELMPCLQLRRCYLEEEGAPPFPVCQSLPMHS